MNILNNAGLIFTGVYLHYQNMPKETMFERKIAERIKLRRKIGKNQKKRAEHKQWIV